MSQLHCSSETSTKRPLNSCMALEGPRLGLSPHGHLPPSACSRAGQLSSYDPEHADDCLNLSVGGTILWCLQQTNSDFLPSSLVTRDDGRKSKAEFNCKFTSTPVSAPVRAHTTEDWLRSRWPVHKAARRWPVTGINTDKGSLPFYLLCKNAEAANHVSKLQPTEGSSLLSKSKQRETAS